MIPVSTCIGDPHWYHDGQEKSHTFIDKRGILNGLRCNELAPGEKCRGLCYGNCEIKTHHCAFLSAYHEQLESLDIQNLVQRCERAATAAQNLLDFKEEPVIVFMVHEAPDNPCSERKPLLDYFNSHGIDCKELSYPIE